MNTSRAVRALSDAVQVRTVSYSDRALMDSSEFERFHALLEATFPLVHSRLEKTALGHNLLFRWRGSPPTAGAPVSQPIALMSHMDVVPADDEGWEHPPFSGDVADGFVWGRGTLDIKVGLIGILEAIEELLEQGFAPACDVYVISSCDEEIGERGGINDIADYLAAAGVRLAWVLDEGGVVGDGMLPGLTRSLAVVGVAEKGYLDLELSVEMPGGHSSSPGRATSIGVLGQAVARIEASQMPGRLIGPVAEFLAQVGPHLPQPRRLLLSNPRLFAPFIVRALLASPETAAMVRTTTAPTMINGGVKPNVLAPRASALVNFRVLPGDTADDVVAHVTAAIGDPRVKVKVLVDSPASTVSPAAGAGFDLIRQCIGEFWPEAVTAPYLVTGATDSKALESLADGVYRFTPCRLSRADLNRMHSVNERVSIENIETAVQFFKTIILRAQE
ncbi:MAG: Succinyl-diaminopimelate desuccinylase [Firmicutes bacterium ADurb.Bin506]|jgi:carboxypeptidase PM20D1|nr:MAG: Succinyl-diaminopimelate desuccinylase [Firmicutes bacterium ADurb.Bin506]